MFGVIRYFLLLLGSFGLLTGCVDRPLESEPTPPPAPSEVVIYRQGYAQTATLRWHANPYAVEHRMLRSQDYYGPYETVATTQEAVWTDGMIFERAYYRVQSLYSDGRLSANSKTVGYVRFEVEPYDTFETETYPFGLPFVFWIQDTSGAPVYGSESQNPEDIIGNQANPGDYITADRVFVQSENRLLFRLASLDSLWLGGDMPPASAFVYMNKTDEIRTILLMGDADFRSLVPPVEIGYTPYSWREPRELSINVLGLLEQGFIGGDAITSDQIIEQGEDHLFAYYDTETSRFDGTLSYITPGKAYWIVNNHPGHDWTYEYRAP